MWTIETVPFAAIPVKAVSDAKPDKAKPKNEHQGRMCVALHVAPHMILLHVTNSLLDSLAMS